MTPTTNSPSPPAAPSFLQPDLWAHDEMEYRLPEADDGVHPKYDGSVIKRDRPHIYDFIVRALGDGWSKGRLREITRCHMYVLSAIEQAEATSIEAAKKMTAAKYGQLASLCIERAIEKVIHSSVEDLSLRELGQTADIATKNQQLLLGQATDRRESTAPAPASEDMLAGYLASLQAAQVEDLPPMGLPRRIPALREADPTPPEVEPSATDEPVTRSQPDSESGDCTSIHKDSTP